MEKLTNQEEVIMLRIWQLNECAVKDIVQLLEEPQPPYTTVASVVRNLEQKGYVQTRKFGNVNVYSPKVSEEEYKKQFMSGVIKNYFSNSYKELVSFFAREEQISQQDLDEIIKMIEDRKK